MSTWRVDSGAVWLVFALLAAACSATESKGDVDFKNDQLVDDDDDSGSHTGGKSFMATGGARTTGGSNPGGSSAGGSGAVGGGGGGGGGTGGTNYATGGSTTPGCPAKKPNNGVFCSSLGTQCNYTVEGATCECVQGTLSGVWQCSTAGG